MTTHLLDINLTGSFNNYCNEVGSHYLVSRIFQWIGLCNPTSVMIFYNCAITFPFPCNELKINLLHWHQNGNLKHIRSSRWVHCVLHLTPLLCTPLEIVVVVTIITLI